MTERKRPDDPADWTAEDWRAQAEAVNQAAARLVAKGWPHNSTVKGDGDAADQEGGLMTGSGTHQRSLQRWRNKVARSNPHDLFVLLPHALGPATLQRGGYTRVEELRRATDAELLRVFSYGPHRLRELRDWLAAHPDVGALPALPWWVTEE